jgi:hypothetical protein
MAVTAVRIALLEASKIQIRAEFDPEVTSETHGNRYPDNVRQITLPCIPQHS